MTKQELLTKLATECATWDAAIENRAEIARKYLLKSFCTGVFDDEVHQISEQEWLAERERLLNKPSWNDAPEGATHLEMARDGLWCFFDNNPRGIYFLYILNNPDSFQVASKAIAIPAGYDWKQSLEERPV